MSVKKGKAQKRQKTNQTVSNKETPDPQSKKQITLRLKNVVDFAKFSFELEEKREQGLVNQSGQMLTAFSVVSAAILMAVQILIDCEIVSKRIILISAGVTLAPMFLSMALALLSRWRFSYVTMITGQELLQKIEANANNHVYQYQYDYQWLDQLANIQNSKKKNNDIRGILIYASMIVFFYAVASLVTCSVIIAFGE